MENFAKKNRPGPGQSFSRCPIDIAVHLLSNKWTIPLVRELLRGPQRPLELERTLVGISAKTLAERLQQLQSAGLVSRVSHPEVPPRVEYSLTELGEEMREIMILLKNFGEKWMSAREIEVYGTTACTNCLSDSGDPEHCPAVPDLLGRSTSVCRSRVGMDNYGLDKP